MDPQTLTLHARTTTHRRLVDASAAMLAEHVDRAPDTYIAWSGGKDSTALAVLAEHTDARLPVIRCTHGVDYPELVTYTADLAQARGWDYRIADVETADAYLTRSLDEDNSSYADDVTPVLGYRPTSWCYGLRASESRRRAMHLYSRRGHWPNRAGGWTCAPLWRWELIDVYAWLHTHNIPLCPVYDRLTEIGCPIDEQRVGFVFGGGGGPARYAWLRRGWPHLWAEYTTRWPHLTHTTET